MKKKKRKLTPGEKLLAGAIGVALFPLALTLEVSIDRANKYNCWGKYKKKPRKR